MQGTIQWLLFTNSIHTINTYQPRPVVRHLQVLIHEMNESYSWFVTCVDILFFY